MVLVVLELAVLLGLGLLQWVTKALDVFPVVLN